MSSNGTSRTLTARLNRRLLQGVVRIPTEHAEGLEERVSNLESKLEDVDFKLEELEELDSKLEEVSEKVEDHEGRDVAGDDRHADVITERDGATTVHDDPLTQ